MCVGWQEKQHVGCILGKDVRVMAKRLILLVALAALVCTSAAQAVTPGRGSKGRKMLRYSYYAQYLQNDKLRIYEEYGYSMHRLRVYGYGRILEHWKYYDLGLEFVFDEDSNLVETNHFAPENRRERFEVFPGY
jgi:hypothetical protein